jgi:hypothetical protein
LQIDLSANRIGEEGGFAIAALIPAAPQSAGCQSAPFFAQSTSRLQPLLSLNLAGNLLRQQFLVKLSQHFGLTTNGEGYQCADSTERGGDSNKRKRAQHAALAAQAPGVEVVEISGAKSELPLLVELDLQMNIFDAACPIVKECLGQLQAVPSWNVLTSESAHRIHDGCLPYG